MTSFAPEQSRGTSLLPMQMQTFAPAKTVPLDLLPTYELETVSSAITERFLQSSLFIPVETSRQPSTRISDFYANHKGLLRILAAVGVAFILLGIFFVVAPSDGAQINPFQLFQSSDNLVAVTNPSSIALTAQQKAIIKKVTVDGYESNVHSYVGLPTAPATITSPGSTLDKFTYGQCTYWADERYHQLTGYWVSWLGNAYQWTYGAAAAGWVVSSTPSVPSIIVLQPGVQGAGYYGHVAVVESINGDGSVVASNMNWYANGGGWNRVNDVVFHTGRGVNFVSHP